MPEIAKIYRQEVPATRFVGHKYGDQDQAGGGFGAQWDDWHANGRFDVLAKLSKGATFEDSDAFIGLMRHKDTEPFEYWIGMFLPAGTEVPDGFLHIDFPKSSLGVVFVKGGRTDVYGQEFTCATALRADGMEVTTDADGAQWFFERYVCPRFTEQDDKGNIILDICHFVK